MKKNVGNVDKVIRILLAALVVVLYFFTNLIPGILGIVLLVVAGVLVLTAIFGICPLYSLIKVSTKKE
jgi:hypothetical protein